MVLMKMRRKIDHDVYETLTYLNTNFEASLSVVSRYCIKIPWDKFPDTLIYLVQAARIHDVLPLTCTILDEI